MDAKQCKEAAADCPQSQPTTEVDSIQYNALQENLLLRLQLLQVKVDRYLYACEQDFDLNTLVSSFERCSRRLEKEQIDLQYQLSSVSLDTGCANREDRALESSLHADSKHSPEKRPTQKSRVAELIAESGPSLSPTSKLGERRVSSQPNSPLLSQTRKSRLIEESPHELSCTSHSSGEVASSSSSPSEEPESFQRPKTTLSVPLPSKKKSSMIKRWTAYMKQGSSSKNN